MSRRYTYVPKSYIKKFERDMKRIELKEKRDRIARSFRREMIKLEDKSKRIKYVVEENNSDLPNDKNKEFRESVQKHTIDYDKVKAQCKKKQDVKINETIIKFLEEKNVSIRDMGISQSPDGHITIKYIDKEGNAKYESFTKEELLNMALEYDGQEQN